MKSISMKKISHGVARADLTKTGKRLLMNVWAWEEIERYYPIHDFTPGVKVFFECAKEYARTFYYRRNLRLFDGSPSAVIESLNNVVERIRSIVRGCAFKSEQNAHRRLSNKNYKSLLDYIEAIFEQRSRVLVLRVDLGYSKALVQRSFRQDLSFDEVKKHREKLLRLLRRKLPAKTFLGHAWKLEFGLSKSYHYHCVFFWMAQNCVKMSLGQGLLVSFGLKELQAGRGCIITVIVQRVIIAPVGLA